MVSRLEKCCINANPYTVNCLFLSQIEWTAAYMEAEEHISKREGCSVPTGTENPWFYSQRGQCDGTLPFKDFTFFYDTVRRVFKNLSAWVKVVLNVTVACTVFVPCS